MTLLHLGLYQMTDYLLCGLGFSRAEDLSVIGDSTCMKGMYSVKEWCVEP